MISKSSVVVRYAETDQMGIVHHSVYPIWYELGRTNYIKELGYSHSQLEAMGIMTPLLRLECNYHSPAHYEDVLDVYTALTHVSRVKLTFCYRLIRPHDDTLIGTGKTILGIVGKDFKPMNTSRLYPALYEKLAQAVIQEAAFYE